MSRDRVELKKTKKEHYVPKCYLKRWENTNGRVYVYDKKNNTHWISGIDDIACERFFYDIKHTGLNNDNLMFLHEHGVYPEKDDQFIEHFFASQIEPEYSKTLENILDKEKSPWYKDNCFFIGKEKRFILSICLVYQYVRTKSVRGLMIDFSNCIGKLLNDLGCDEETRNMHILKPGMEKVVQGNMILDINHVLELAEAFCRLTWVLGVNKSGIPLYTSDNPLGTVGHIKHPFLSTAGICNRGVEVYMPLSPNYILIMVDAEYHRFYLGKDRSFMSIDNPIVVERYNQLCVYNSYQYVFSRDEEYKRISEIIEENSEQFACHKSLLSYGGKAYCSQDMMV